jgi:hypothetical protein
MRRLYVAPVEVMLAHKDIFHPAIGAHGLHLITYTNPLSNRLMHSDPAVWEALPEVIEWRANGSPVLVSTSLEHSESAEDKWHSHPEVAILPHPVFEGKDKLVQHKDSTTKKLKQKHLDALAKKGITENDTVWEVSDKAKAMQPQCCLRAIL